MSNEYTDTSADEILFISKEAKNQVDINSLIPKTKTIVEELEQLSLENSESIFNLPVVLKTNVGELAAFFNGMELVNKENQLNILLTIDVATSIYYMFVKKFTEQSIDLTAIQVQEPTDDFKSLIQEKSYLVGGIKTILLGKYKTRIEVNLYAAI